LYISGFQSRFTVCGSRLLDERIKWELRYLVNFLLEQHAGLKQPLAAIWLGGAYGRAEGAVFRLPENEKPWFDYDIYLVYQVLNPEYAAPLRLYPRWQTHCFKQLGTAIELRTPGDQHAVTHLPSHLIWYDLTQAYQVLWGDHTLTPALHETFAPSLETALQLLLYWGGQWLALLPLDRRDFAQVDAQTLQHVWYRTAAALGDACLMVLHQYDSSTQERARRFHAWQSQNGQRWVRELGYLYQEALQYRILPSDFVRHSQDMFRRCDQLSDIFVSAYLFVLEQFAQHKLQLTQVEQALLSPQQGRLPWRTRWQHLLHNFRLFQGQSFHGSWYLQHPIHRLYFLLPYLLLRQDKPEADVLKRVCPGLLPEADWHDLQVYFFKLWQSTDAQSLEKV